MSKSVIADSPIIDQAEFNGITIRRKEGGSIEIIGGDFKNIKDALKTIAKEAGITYQNDWNTRYLGYRIIKALKHEYVDDKSLIGREAILVNDFIATSDAIGCNDQVLITRENIAKVEAMISYDSKYSRSSDPTSFPDSKWIEKVVADFKAMPDAQEDDNTYKGSSAFWMNRIRDYYNNEVLEMFDAIARNRDYYTFLVYNSVCAVDVENSTHINADMVGRAELTMRIVEHEKNFISMLKNTNEYPLIKILSAATNPKDNLLLKKKYKARENFSFATKFCHYACFHIFKEMDIEFRDSYSIYDNVVSTAIMEHFKEYVGGDDFTAIEDDYVKKYSKYIAVIDRIRNNKVSRNGFDHLLWYYYKGRGRRKTEAKYV